MVKLETWPVNGLPPHDAARIIAGESLWEDLETSARIFGAARPPAGRRVRSWGPFTEKPFRPAQDPGLAEIELRYRAAATRIQEQFHQALIDGRVFAVGVLDKEERRALIPPELFDGCGVSLRFTATMATRQEGGARRPLYRAVRLFEELSAAKAYAVDIKTTVSQLKPFGPKTFDFVASFFESSDKLREEVNAGEWRMRRWKTAMCEKIQLEYKNKHGINLERTTVSKALNTWLSLNDRAKVQPAKPHLKIAK